MNTERTLVLIKPDAMIKNLYGSILQEIARLDLKMIGLKLVNVDDKLAEIHYEEHKEKPQFEKLKKHLKGEFHKNENVIAICYKGESAIQRIRELVGETDPNNALPNTIRGRFGRIHIKTEVYENAIHASDSEKSAEREINLWFKPEELIE